MKTILSLFDYTGNWSEPYRKAGYKVIQIDLKHGHDIFESDYLFIDKEIHGILAAIPCTDYALSGAKHFKKKDANGQTEYSNQIVAKTRDIIEYCNPNFWVIENPMSRIHKLHPWLGEVKYKFNPCDFAGYGYPEERYNKQTWLFGVFNKPIKKPMAPLDKEYPGFLKLGGKSERTKELRSATPKGFAQAFFEVNR